MKDYYKVYDMTNYFKDMKQELLQEEKTKFNDVLLFIGCILFVTVLFMFY